MYTNHFHQNNKMQLQQKITTIFFGIIFLLKKLIVCNFLLFFALAAGIV